ncbi:MAG: YkgJ family cysteine cluster protein [Moraxellaceae bacterium]|nr:YkgJ family cysteine cluster protein [Moraxellaceae bacterium]
MSAGKPAGMPCVQLDAAGLCRLFGKPERPAFCASLKAHPDMCGDSREAALRLLGQLEADTRP